MKQTVKQVHTRCFALHHLIRFNLVITGGRLIIRMTLLRIQLNIFCYFILDINECSSSPCQNGGTCTDHVNKYTCSCIAGYTGTNCQTGLSMLDILCFITHYIPSQRTFSLSMDYKNDIIVNPAQHILLFLFQT